MRFVVILFLATYSCSPTIVPRIQNPQASLTQNDIVIVLSEVDTFTNRQNYIGSLSSKDNGFSTNCSYAVIIDHFKKQASTNGANVIKITSRKKPDHHSSCERVTAELFKIDDPSIYETQIEWNENKKLKWEDFKGSQPGGASQVAASTHCGFGFASNKVRIFSKPVLHVSNTFDCKLSWVRKDQTTRPELLEHEQLHFDLSELYARRLRKEFSSAKFSYFNVQRKAEAIFEIIYKNYLQRQQAFEVETSYSLNKTKQAEWVKQVAEEIKSLSLYAN